MKKEEVFPYWNELAGKALKGKSIVRVRYLTEDEKKHLMWDKSSIVIHLNTGEIMFPSMDDEGNDAETLFIEAKKGDLIAPDVCTARDMTKEMPKIRRKLMNQEIVDAGYLPKDEAELFGLHSLPVFIRLENGVTLFPMDRIMGEYAGAMFTTIEGANTLPVLPMDE